MVKHSNEKSCGSYIENENSYCKSFKRKSFEESKCSPLCPMYSWNKKIIPIHYSCFPRSILKKMLRTIPNFDSQENREDLEYNKMVLLRKAEEYSTKIIFPPNFVPGLKRLMKSDMPFLDAYLLYLELNSDLAFRINTA